MPNPYGMADQMPPPPQGNNPWPHPMEGIEFLLGLLRPDPMQMNAFNEQGQFSPSGALGSAVDMGGQLVGMADLPGKKQLAGMAGRMMNRGGDDLARAMGGYGDNAAGSVRGNIPPQSPDPMNLGAMDQLPPPGGGAPPMDMPNQAYNDMINMREHNVGRYHGDVGGDSYLNQRVPNEVPYNDQYDDMWYRQNPGVPEPEWGNPGYPEGTSMGPGEAPPWDDMWYRQNPGVPEPELPPPGMSIMASSADPEMLIRQAALDMIQQGVPPAEAIQAATMQFSDLLVP